MVLVPDRSAIERALDQRDEARVELAEVRRAGREQIDRLQERVDDLKATQQPIQIGRQLAAFLTHLAERVPGGKYPHPEDAPHGIALRAAELLELARTTGKSP